MHVEALQWLNSIFTRRTRANCHQLYELGDITNNIEHYYYRYHHYYHYYYYYYIIIIICL